MNSNKELVNSKENFVNPKEELPNSKNELVNSKDELNIKITNLKNEIQDLIDYKKNNLNNLSKDELKLIDENKKKYIENISNYTNQLKDIIKKEKQKITLLNNIKKAQNANDSISYYLAKKSNNVEELDKLKKNKEIRENVRQEYLYYLNLEENFYKLDSLNLPGILFLHQNIITEYGLCPFIIGDINLNNINEYNITQESSNLEENRRKWLEKTNDNGKLYYELYENIYQKKEMTKLIENLKNLEDRMERTIKDFLSNSQYDIYNECVIMIDEYNNCTIKTKKIKEKYKLIIHNLSILYSETGLYINKYLEIKHSLNLPINSIDGNKKESKDNDFYIIKNFEENISEYQIQIDKINQKNKYITNIKKNLKQDFHEFLMNKNTLNIQTNKQNDKQCSQEGKYFKNWSNLTIDEKKERLLSFSQFYVNKFIETNLEKDNLIQQLSEILNEKLDSKKLTCKDLTWKSNKGIIEKIKNLNFDKENNTFYLDKKQQNDTSDLKLNKSLSKKTIFQKINEKVINEEMLKFILKYNQNQYQKCIENYIDEFIERIKMKLKFKKISKDDKNQIIKQLLDMNNIIKNNPSI